MKNEDFLLIVNQQHKDVIRLIEVTKMAINAETKASADMLNLQIGQVIKRQDISNGKVYKLESQTRLIRWIGQNPKLSVPIFAIFGVGLYFVLQLIGIKIFF